jgi:hypothetical protein
VKYLAEVDRIGAVIDRQEIQELSDLLGTAPSSVAAGRAALAERDDYLMRTASGALRNRTWPTLFEQGDQERWVSQSPKTIAN